MNCFSATVRSSTAGELWCRLPFSPACCSPVNLPNSCICRLSAPKPLKFRGSKCSSKHKRGLSICRSHCLVSFHLIILQHLHLFNLGICSSRFGSTVFYSPYISRDPTEHLIYIANMKITTIIAPFILYASLAEGAKKKKPKAPKNGSGSEETETVTEEAAQETARDV